MPVAPNRHTHIPRAHRFGYLMALYAENFVRFERLFQLQEHTADHWQSSVDDALDVHLQVVERHRYTTEVRLTYDLPDPVTGEPDPSAFLRIYRDSRQIEATHCYVGRRWQDVLGLNPEIGTLVGHRLRMNTFLGKWLDFLAEQGHSPFTLTPGRADACRWKQRDRILVDALVETR